MFNLIIQKSKHSSVITNFYKYYPYSLISHINRSEQVNIIAVRLVIHHSKQWPYQYRFESYTSIMLASKASSAAPGHTRFSVQIFLILPCKKLMAVSIAIICVASNLKYFFKGTNIFCFKIYKAIFYSYLNLHFSYLY